MSVKLNPSQRKAVEVLRGPLLVLAGAGSGKTRVVTLRIANLIAQGIAPDRILAVTFTNKAAAEMLQRITEIVKPRGRGGARNSTGKRTKVARPLISTFHSYCVRVLRRHIAKLGYPANYAIYDYGDQFDVARGVLREVQVTTAQLKPSDLIHQISNWKSASLSPQQAARQARADEEHYAAAAFRRYQATLKNRGAVDFDDLLLLTDTLFAEHEDVRLEEAGRFDHLLVDEYQDTNAVQYRLIQALAKDHQNLCVVGDDDQSIYRWRGAEVEHILRFQKDWNKATVVYLEENYRSTGNILLFANRLIRHNSKRYPKTLKAVRPDGPMPVIRQCKDDTHEATVVVGDIQRLLSQPGVEPRDVAVLFRTNEQPRSFEDAFRKAKISYVMMGAKSFFDVSEVRDTIAYLRAIERPQDEPSLLRILNKPTRGISAATIKSLVSAAHAQECSVWDIIRSPEPLELRPAALKQISMFAGLIEKYQQRFRQQTIASSILHLMEEIEYFEYLSRLHTDPDNRDVHWNNVSDIAEMAANYESRTENPSLRQFLDDAVLGANDFSDDKSNRLKQNSVALMTLHSAKGLEYPHVFLVGLEEGILPHRRSVIEDGDAIEEERRLCYVGVTRAQDSLTLSFPLSRIKRRRRVNTHVSRFLYELADKADHFVQPEPPG